MTGDANLIADTARRIFRELGEPQSLRSDAQRARLWLALDDAGLTRTWVPESLGGSGATLADGFNVIRIAGEYASANALADTLLAGWLLGKAGISVPNEVLTVAPVDIRDHVTLSSAGKLTGTARAVPFARNAAHLAVFAMDKKQAYIALVDRRLCVTTEHANLAGDARDTVTLNNVSPTTIVDSPLQHDALMQMGAAVRATQMAGALQTILDLSVTYANERVAFAKPIGKFQAIQHSLAKLAGEVAAALAAASSAADAIDSATRFDDAVFLEIASAKIRVGEAVSTGAAIAHQVHGAIGFSQEHVLHCYTQRLWAWRDDFGGESYWATRLGTLVAHNGVDALWPMLAAR